MRAHCSAPSPATCEWVTHGTYRVHFNSNAVQMPTINNHPCSILGQRFYFLLVPFASALRNDSRPPCASTHIGAASGTPTRLP